MIDSLLSGGIGFFAPKKADGLGAREIGRVLLLDRGLEVPLGLPVGLKEFAAGFGLNFMAFTLNLADTEEVGLSMLPDVCGLGIRGAVPTGFFGSIRGSCIGKGVGIETGIPALCCWWLLAKRWLKRRLSAPDEFVGPLRWRDVCVACGPVGG